MSVVNARTRFQVRLTVTDTSFSPGLDLFGIVGDDPTADAVASAALPEHGLAVGADGSLWTCNGTAWAQIAGAGGALGPVPDGQGFQIGTSDGYSTFLFDGNRTRWSVASVSSGAGRFLQVQSGNTTAAGQAPGDILLVPGENSTDNTVGDVVFNRGGVDMSAAQWTQPAPYDESDDNILAMPLQRLYPVSGGSRVDITLPYDCAVVSAVVYANAAVGGSTAAVSVERDPDGAPVTLFTANIDSSGTSATILPGAGGKVGAGTVIGLDNSTGGEVNVLLTVLAYRA